MSPETHFAGTRQMRCFPERPRSLHALLANAVARQAGGSLAQAIAACLPAAVA